MQDRGDERCADESHRLSARREGEAAHGEQQNLAGRGRSLEHEHEQERRQREDGVERVLGHQRPGVEHRRDRDGERRRSERLAGFK